MFDALFAQDFEGGIVIVRLGVVMAAEVGRQVGGGEGGNSFDYLHACGAALVNKLGYGERLPREHIPMKTRERKRHVVRCVFPDPRPRR